jgi:hypothetical protein
MRNAIWFLVPFVAGLVILQLIGFHFENGPRVFSLGDVSGGGSRNAPYTAGTEVASPQPVTARRLSQAQDEYLQLLLNTPGNEQVMRRLVAVRRRLADDNPLTLLRQSAALQKAAAIGKETAEQHSADRMRVLALADTRAATEILAEGGRNSSRSIPRATSGPSRNIAPAAGASPPRSSASSVDSRGAQSGAQPSADLPTPGMRNANAAFSAAPGPKQTFSVSVRSSDLPIVSSRGNLFGVDCQQRAFMLHSSDGDEEYYAAPNIIMYLRGSRSEKLVDFCGLQHFLGQTVLVWSTVDGHRNISTALSVLMPAP